ncbi:hypothetical protein G3480_20565 [Thiorhodococcus mannitoliphagus]|uniref:Uncharacterized protein n=1 Tax=Thiorhodococcus mannitoliphagus TaxID=329406 RepID=A0A6P1DYW3_9GAMM|nr:hypothetical protein [Thiorhodococcus mannitoliphagus]NEX22670.1 hypothetical protein [Thiorhodococcus mannitoliphagus]
MDRLTRNSIIISAILLVLLIISLSVSQNELRPRVWQLNELLEKDPVLASYPYQFRVLLFLNGVVTLTSPHASEVPLEPFLAKVDPKAAGKPKDSPEMRAAEQHFREIEMRAIQVMVSQPDIRSVVWSLDKAWYHKNRVPSGR